MNDPDDKGMRKSTAFFAGSPYSPGTRLTGPIQPAQSAHPSNCGYSGYARLLACESEFQYGKSGVAQ